jgi:DNA-binding NarL/FixJ family response regulator
LKHCTLPPWAAIWCRHILTADGWLVTAFLYIVTPSTRALMRSDRALAYLSPGWLRKLFGGELSSTKRSEVFRVDMNSKADDSGSYRMKPITVLVADDHPILLVSFSQLLADYGINVVEQARTPEDAVSKYSQERPEVAVLDVRFGGKRTGLDAARSILESFPDARIVFFSQFDEVNLVREAYRLGGLAFVTEDCDLGILVTAIERAREGGCYFVPRVAERLAQLAIKGDTSPRGLLKERELAIFTLMAQGHTAAEVAETMNLSLKTINNASQTIKEKLGVSRPADITRLAIKYGLIEA